MKNKINVLHASFKHQRYDPRIFRRMCRTLAQCDKYLVHLYIADSLGSEFIDGVHIGVFKTHNKLNILKFLFLYIPSLLIYARNNSIQIIHFHDPEFLIVTPLLRLFGYELIYDAHEPYRDKITVRLAEKKLKYYIILVSFDLVEFVGIYFTRSIIVPQHFMKKNYERWRDKVIVIHNFPTKGASEYKVNKTVALGKINVIYAGSITADRGIWEILDNLAGLEKINLTLCGVVDPELKLEISKHHNWKKVNFLGEINEHTLHEEYSKNDIGLIFFRNKGQYRTTYGLKTFEYMQHGLALLMPEIGDWPNFNQKFRLGFCVNTVDADIVRNLVNSLDVTTLKNVGNRNRINQSKYFSFEQECKQLQDLYIEMLE